MGAIQEAGLAKGVTYWNLELSDASAATSTAVAKAVLDAGLTMDSLSRGQRTLEDVFTELERQAAASGRVHDACSSRTRLRSKPMPGTWTSTTSPAFRYFGGSNLAPAPFGVPVAMMSPGFR